MITVDGISYDDLFVVSLERSFAVTDSESTGRTEDYTMHRDIVGTFYNYKMAVEMRSANQELYYSFYDTISSPTASHYVTFPYNGETLSFDAYVTKGTDKFTMVNGMVKWSGLTVDFISMAPQRGA